MLYLVQVGVLETVVQPASDSNDRRSLLAMESKASERERYTDDLDGKR